MAAGLMSGVEGATDEELAGDSEHSAPALRRKLSAQLGEEVFAAAHARLQCVAEVRSEESSESEL